MMFMAYGNNDNDNYNRNNNKEHDIDNTANTTNHSLLSLSSLLLSEV